MYFALAFESDLKVASPHGTRACNASASTLSLGYVTIPQNVFTAIKPTGAAITASLLFDIFRNGFCT